MSLAPPIRPTHLQPPPKNQLQDKLLDRAATPLSSPLPAAWRQLDPDRGGDPQAFIPLGQSLLPLEPVLSPLGQAPSPAGQPLRLGVDPLHAHLLPPENSGQEELRLAFLGAAEWVVQLKRGLVDAVLLPLAGMVGPSEPPEPLALTAASALNPSLGDPDVVAIAVATTALPFLVAAHHLVLPGSPEAPRSADAHRPASLPRPEVLLPPACHQPLLHADLRRQGLLPLRSCDDLNPAVWVDLLQRERLLLPAPPSLLACSPWRQAGLIALPPADPLWEALWLLVRQEHLAADWVEEWGAGLAEGCGGRGKGGDGYSWIPGPCE